MYFLFESLEELSGLSKSHNLGRSPDDEKLLMWLSQDAAEGRQPGPH